MSNPDGAPEKKADTPKTGEKGKEVPANQADDAKKVEGKEGTVADKLDQEPNPTKIAEIMKKANFGEGKEGSIQKLGDKQKIEDAVKKADKATVLGTNVNFRDRAGKTTGQMLQNGTEVQVDHNAKVVEVSTGKGKQYLVPVKLNGKEGLVSANFLKLTPKDGDKPAEGGDKPAEGGDKPTEGGDKPAEGGDKPAEGGDKPAEGGDKPTEGGDEPAEGGDKPAEGGDKPAEGGDGKPTAQSGGPAYRADVTPPSKEGDSAEAPSTPPTYDSRTA